MSFVSQMDTNLLVERLAKVDVGGKVTYPELSEVVGGDVTTGRLRGCLNSARRILERDKRIVFGVDRRRGLVRLSDEQIVGTARSVRDHIRRSARKGMKTLTAVDYETLQPSAKIRHQCEAAYLAATEAISTDRGMKAIEARVDPQKHLPLGETLEAFRAMEGRKPLAAS